MFLLSFFLEKVFLSVFIEGFRGFIDLSNLYKTMIKSIVKVKPTENFKNFIDDNLCICIPLPASQRSSSTSNLYANAQDSMRFYNLTAYESPGEICQSIGELDENISYCIFAYGESGSGKTYTIVESSEAVIKHVINGELRAGPIRIEIFEIYNEQIYDLLSDDPNIDLKMRQRDGEFIVDDLSVHLCRDHAEFSKLLARAIRARAVAETKLNRASSRSHLDVRISNDRKPGRYVNVIDLAGSERVKKSGVSGTGLTEAININKSLSCLSLVLYKLEKKQAHIPFRDSTLTKILMNSMKSQIFVIACVNCDSYEETIKTLDFADVARRVEIREITSFEEQEETEVKEGSLLDSQELQKTQECLDRAKKIIQSIEAFRERLNFGLNKRS
jgi:hypothetical protein